MKKPIAPCIDCPDRSAECHGSCKRYAEWQTAHIAYKREKHKQKNPEIYNYIVSKRYRGRNNDQR